MYSLPSSPEGGAKIPAVKPMSCRLLTCFVTVQKGSRLSGVFGRLLPHRCNIPYCWLTCQTTYTKHLLCTHAFAHKNLYTEQLLRTEAFAQRSLYAQKLLDAPAFTPRSFWTGKPLHRAARKYRSFYTGRPWNTQACTHRRICTRKFLH